MGAAGDARAIVNAAKSDYGIWFCPNGGEHTDDVFRVGHIGDIGEADQAALLQRLERSLLDSWVNWHFPRLAL